MDKGLATIFGLAGKVAMVTGAASGLGAHFAGTLAAAGAAVVCTARRTDRIEGVAEAIRAAGGTAMAVPMDVTCAASVEAAFANSEAALGGIDILVNNAGQTAFGPFYDSDDEAWDRVMEVNLKGMWRVAVAAARRMAGRGRGGTIVNVASILGFLAKPGFAHYGASKAAVLHLTRAMALDLLASGIRVNAIAPGYFGTEMTDWYFETDAGRQEIEGLPLKRLGRLTELDGPLLLLASDASSFMNGSILTVDAGHSTRLS